MQLLCSVYASQGSGLGLNVSVSRRTNVSVSSREELSTSQSLEADVSVSSWSRPFTFRAQNQFNSFLIGMQMAPYAV